MRGFFRRLLNAIVGVCILLFIVLVGFPLTLTLVAVIGCLILAAMFIALFVGLVKPESPK